jgi:hypothetical protein
MQGIGGDQRAVQVDLAGHDRGHRHFVRFHPDLGLGGDDRGLRGAADERGQQMPLVTRVVPGAPHRLAI